MFIDLDAFFVVEFDAGFFRAESFGERLASDGNQNLVGFEFQFLDSFRRDRSGATVFDFHGGDFGFEMKCHALRGERTLQEIRKFEIKTKSNPRQEF